MKDTAAPPFSTARPVGRGLRAPLSASDDYVLVIGGEAPMRERSMAGALRASGGAKVYSVSSNPHADGLRYFDGYFQAGIADHAAIIEQMHALRASTGAAPIAVVPTTDFTVEAAAKCAAEFGLYANSTTTVEICRDKAAMKKALESAGVPVAKFETVSGPDDLDRIADEIKFPLVLKPRYMGGSLGVIKVEQREQLVSAYEESVRAVASIKGVARRPEDLFQVEEYIDYPHEVSVELINFPGYEPTILAITDKLTGAEPYFVEVGHLVPSMHCTNSALRGAAIRACAALRIDYGMAHFEAKVSSTGEIRAIEIAARPGGDGIMDLIEEVYGVNPYELHVLSYLGHPPHRLTDTVRADTAGVAAVGFLTAPPGKVVAVDKLPEAPYSGLIRSITLSAEVGDVVRPLTSWRERLGFVRFSWERDATLSNGDCLNKDWLARAVDDLSRRAIRTE